MIYIVEIKYYRSKNVQMTLINNAIEYLQYYSSYKKVLIIPNFITKSERAAINELDKNITLLDGYDLFNLTIQTPLLNEKLKSLLVMEYFNQDYLPSDHESNFIKKLKKDNKTLEKFKKEKLESFKKEELIRKLDELKPGRENFKKYESLCADIITYLFESAVTNKKQQVNTDNNLYRYDLVARINPTTEFWKFIISEIQSRYVIFEFKNYSEKIDQEQILTTEKYLFSQALRKVAIIFSRKGGDESADKFIRGALRESGKTIIVLNDDDVIKMITAKEKGDAPELVLFEKIDTLFMTLSR
ncbi:hypothetical protein DPW03_09680 [Aggregatibacter aphrophilus]|jgi:hypothetical protein|nr:hypothetical protein DPW03_09680 [Aggregatibacter aphrophilus]RDE96890.1 hypothetical protein DPW02_08530 [Aggregatibacter aphrophilus]